MCTKIEWFHLPLMKKATETLTTGWANMWQHSDMDKCGKMMSLNDTESSTANQISNTGDVKKPTGRTKMKSYIIIHGKMYRMQSGQY